MKRTELKRKTPLRAKTPMRKKAKAHTRGWYSKALEDIAKRFAKERDGYFCQKEGIKVEGSNAHGSHVIPVSAGNALRWDLLNIKCLSYHNHLNWWHKNPIEAAEWFKRRFPERDKYLALKRREMQAIGASKISTPDLIVFYELAKTCKSWEEYALHYEHTIGRR